MQNTGVPKYKESSTDREKPHPLKNKKNIFKDKQIKKGDNQNNHITGSNQH